MIYVFNPHHTPIKDNPILSSSYRWGNRATERLNDLPKSHRLGSDRVGTWLQQTVQSVSGENAHESLDCTAYLIKLWELELPSFPSGPQLPVKGLELVIFQLKIQAQCWQLIYSVAPQSKWDSFSTCTVSPRTIGGEAGGPRTIKLPDFVLLKIVWHLGWLQHLWHRKSKIVQYDSIYVKEKKSYITIFGPRHIMSVYT